MKFWATASSARKAGNWAAAMALGLWLGLMALAVSPQLHRLLHADAQDPAHACLVTQIQQQSFLAGFVVVAAPAAPFTNFEILSDGGFQLVRSWGFRLSPSRGPPSASFYYLA